MSIDNYAPARTTEPANIESLDNRETPWKKNDQVFYLVDWLPPDFGAVGQYGAIYARDLSMQGCNVRLIGLTTGSRSTTSEVLPNGKIYEITKIHSSIYRKLN